MLVERPFMLPSERYAELRRQEAEQEANRSRIAEDLSRQLSEMDEAMQRARDARARIDSMNFEQLADFVWFGSRGLTLDQMRAEAAQWMGNFDTRDLILSFPHHTHHQGEIVRRKLADYSRSNDTALWLAALRLQKMISLNREEI
jgi:hypothetical protein